MPSDWVLVLIIAGTFSVLSGVAWGVLGTVKWYLRERVRLQDRLAQLGSAEATPRIQALEDRVAELEERLDYAERLLAPARTHGPLAPGREG